VAFEDLWITGEEKDSSILELRWAAKTARADLEKEKNVDGVFWYTKHVRYTLVWICLWN
jgi:hypothetical protein